MLYLTAVFRLYWSILLLLNASHLYIWYVGNAVFVLFYFVGLRVKMA